MFPLHPLINVVKFTGWRLKDDFPDREWQAAERGRQSSPAAALGTAGEYSADRDEVRVRAGAVRCLYRASRRQGRPVLSGPALRGGRQNDTDDRRTLRRQQPSSPEGMDRGAGAAMRLLP